MSYHQKSRSSHVRLFIHLSVRLSVSTQTRFSVLWLLEINLPKSLISIAELNQKKKLSPDESTEKNQWGFEIT